MNIIDKLKLSTLYPEFKKIQFDEEILKQIITNKSFKEQYKTIIKPFIEHLKAKEKQNDDQYILDTDMINNHIKAAVCLSMNNNSTKYISFITENNYEYEKINNFNIFNDVNFEKLYSMIDKNIFNENISEIINNGYSERLIEFINNNGKRNLKEINSAIFQDKVWNTIIQNPSIGNTQILELFNSRINTLVDLINKDLFEGLKYTYENIPESHNFINVHLGRSKEGFDSLQQFSMDFIKNIGDETLKKLYERHKFSDENEFKKIFEIVSFKNYELIQDILNYDISFTFKNISVNDMQKQLIETNINNYNKKEVFLNKYFGIEREDIYYIKLFLNAINKVNDLPDEFKEKYSSILQILNSSDEELIKISKKMNLDKKDAYKKLIYACEKDGNDVLKNHFVNELKIKNQQIIDVAEHKEIITNEGRNINVYELSGQPFTMLVHAVVDNKRSVNNSFVKQIVNNPENWDKMNGGNNHISTSLISDKFMVTYGTPNRNDRIMFGFNELPWYTVKFTETADVGIDRKSLTDINYNMRNRSFKSRINTITTVDDLMEQTIETNLKKTKKVWNEIILSRIDETKGMKIKPNFVVCMDEISENSIKAAQYFNVPIYLINRKYYPASSYYIAENNDLSETQSLEEIGRLKR